MVSDGLVLGFNGRTFFEIIGSVLQKRGDVVIREVHEQTLSVLGFHVMIVGQLEIAVNVSLHLLIFFNLLAFVEQTEGGGYHLSALNYSEELL